MLVLGFVIGDRALPRLVAEAAEASDVANCVDGFF
jgi:hypothetical protein